MSERKFTNKEIKEALECCCKTSGCDIRCPFSGRAGRDMCVKYFLDLMNCQQAEIERLSEENKVLSRYEDYIKAEAIKDFAERLKKVGFYEQGTGKFIIDISENHIDNLVKEMAGDAE